VDALNRCIVNNKSFQKRIATLLIGLLALLIVPTAAISAGWQWITPQRAYNLLKEGSGLWFVDLRNEAAFASAHIEGALNIPASLLATKHFPPGKLIVLVDDTLGSLNARETADKLAKQGHERVFLLEGGLPCWQAEQYPIAGEKGHLHHSVMPDELTWAISNQIPLRIFDLRDKKEREEGTVPQAVAIEGKNITERIEKVKTITTKKTNELSNRLEKTATTILIFPKGTDPVSIMDKYFNSNSDIRYVEGGYVAWASRPDKSIKTVGGCPTCPNGGIKR